MDPVGHFRLMSAIAAQMAINSIQLLEHGYSPEHFGSWQLKFRKTTGIFGISFDGRDRFLLLEKGEVDPDSYWVKNWKSLQSEQLQKIDDPGVISETVISLMEKAG